jgi:hypothetical protein
VFGAAASSGDYRMKLLPKAFIVKGVLFFSLIGCAGTANRVMPGYGRMKVANAVLGVILVKKNIQILNADDVGRTLGTGRPAEAYYDFFGAEFPALMKERSKFRQVYFLSGADEALLQGGGAAADNSALRAVLPSRRHFISDSLHYLLIIDYLTVGHERNTTTPVGGGSDGGFAGFFSGAESLTHTADFVVWDNREGTIAAYGNIRERVGIYDAMTKALWLDLLKKTAGAVADGMPYGR